jgi:NAD-dependent SIR2 family protein deacetylase
MDSVLKKTLLAVAAGQGRITVMTGAGISAESGIPTFRGPEGYWTVGSKEYHPQEMATCTMFRQYPEQVWAWYLYRLGVCRRAHPNEGHRALVRLEKLFAERFTLTTQNVDGLHLRAGSSPERTFQIHGNIFFMRCADGCRADLVPNRARPVFPSCRQRRRPFHPGTGRQGAAGNRRGTRQGAFLQSPRHPAWLNGAGKKIPISKFHIRYR